MGKLNSKVTRVSAVPRGVAIALSLTFCLGFTVGCSSQSGGGKPTPPSMSQEERASLAQQEETRLRDEFHAAYPTVEVPSVSRVRFVSLNEWPGAISSCLNEEGFEVKVEDDGVGGLILDGQREPYALAMYICSVKYPVDPKYNVPFNDSQLNYLYDYYTGKLTVCLEKLGITVDKPPSRQKFLETYGAGNWAPYNSVHDTSRWSELNKKCPQIPDGIYG